MPKLSTYILSSLKSNLFLLPLLLHSQPQDPPIPSKHISHQIATPCFMCLILIRVLYIWIFFLVSSFGVSLLQTLKNYNIALEVCLNDKSIFLSTTHMPPLFCKIEVCRLNKNYAIKRKLSQQIKVVWC